MKIKLRNKDKYFFIDDEDYNLIKDFKWYLFFSRSKEYVMTIARRKDGKLVPLVSLSEIAKKRRELTNENRFNSSCLYNNSRTSVILHRLIMNFPKNREIDHINGNGLDNRKSNLRICTRFENGKNRKKSSLNTSGFYGVHLSKDGKRKKRWTSMIRVGGKKKYIGRFFTKTEAAIAYDEQAKKYHGAFATLNFG